MPKTTLYVYGHQVPFNINENESLVREKWAGEVRVNDIVFLEGFSEGFLVIKTSFVARREKVTDVIFSFKVEDSFVEELYKKDSTVYFY